MTMMKMSGSQLSAQQTELRKYSLAFLCEWAGAAMVGNLVKWMQVVINDELGQMLEYNHLKKDPKQKKTFGHSFGNEVRQLAQGMSGQVDRTDTIHVINKSKVPKDRIKDVTNC